MGIWSSLRRLATAKGNRSVQAAADQPERKSRGHRKHRELRLEQCEQRTLMTIGNWVPQGPAPIENGQVTNVGPEDGGGEYLNEVTGAIQAVAAHPTNPDILYVGSVNGGIWRTDNATDEQPDWESQTDLMSSLSIGALAFDPTDSTSLRLAAGTGLWSDFGREGGQLEGVFVTSNGGVTWAEVDGRGLLNGKNIAGIAIRGDVIVVAVNAATTGNPIDAGIFRSTDGGLSFTQISRSSGAATGLPGGLAYDLAYDSTAVGDDANVMYTAVTNASTFNGRNGVYKSTDAGATWERVSDAAMEVLINNDSAIWSQQTGNVRIAVSPKSASGQQSVFVGIVDRFSGELTAVFRSTDGGENWIEMDAPEINEGGVMIGVNPGGQGKAHFSIVADPDNLDVVYIGGDRQPGPNGDFGTFPVVPNPSMINGIGAVDYTGRLFRGDASADPDTQWTHLTDSPTQGPAGGGTANSSGPHSDSRSMVFDARGRLIEVDDGGVYVRTNPEDNTGDWYSLNGDLQINEMHDVAYDAISNIIVGGSQDTGTSEQTEPGSLIWRQVNKGDGGDVAVAIDDMSLANRNESYRYTSSANLRNFTRRTVDATNTVVAGSEINPALIVLGTGGQRFSFYDGGQMVTPIELNAIEPWRMVVAGRRGIYESDDRGASLTLINGPANANAMVYGGTDGPVDAPEVLWVAADSGVYLRGAGGGALTRLAAYPGGNAVDIAVDSTNWRKAYVINDSRVYYTDNAGATWADVTGNYTAAAGLKSLAFVASGSTGAVVVGGLYGVYVAQASNLTTWLRLGDDLPRSPVYDLDYDPQDDILVASTLGRGAFSLSQARAEIFGIPMLISVYTDEGEPLADNAMLGVGPRELTLIFNKNASLDPKTLGGIQITRAGLDGVFKTSDDVIIPYGYISIGNNPNEVIIRFAENLADDEYHITIVGEENYAGPDGVVVGPLRSTSGIPFNATQVTNPDGTTSLVGRNLIRNFTLDLGSQVVGVVPQPVVRKAYNELILAKVPQAGDVLSITRQSTPAVTRKYQFTTAYLEVPVSIGKAQFNDGDTLTIRGFAGTSAVTRVYEFNVTGTLLSNSANVEIPLTAGGQTLNTAFLDTIKNAINNDPNIDVVASFDPYTSGAAKIYLNGFTGMPVYQKTGIGTGLVLRNTTPVVPAGTVGVSIKTTSTKAEVAFSLAQAINASGLGATATPTTDTVQINNTTPLVIDLTGVRVTAITMRDGPIDDVATRANRDVIDVYFNINDPLLNDGTQAAVTNRYLYQLIDTNETATPDDDLVQNPAIVSYDQATGRVRLDFNVGDLFSFGTGAFRLRIGNEYLPVQTTTWTPTQTFDRTTFAAADADAIPANVLGAGGLVNLQGAQVGAQSVIIDGKITSQPYSLLFPGGADEPGHRWLPSHEINVDPNYDSHQGTGGDTSPGASETIRFFFPASVGGYPNQINDTERDLVRQIFEMYARYLGYQVEEGTESGSAIFVGDSRAFKPTAPPQAGGGFATIGPGYVFIAGGTVVGQYDDVFGGNFFGLTMHEIGHNFGYLHDYDMPGVSIMGSSSSTYVPGGTEKVYPGEADIIHGQLIHRPDSNDIDLYAFTLDKPGQLNAETIAERLNLKDKDDPDDITTESLLNSVITIYDSNKQLIARNDDYYGIDSFIDLHLGAGTYYVAVTAQGNVDFNPQVENTGMNGRTSGAYQLRMTFTPDRGDYLSDADYNQTPLDGDLDGRAKGVYDYWLNVQPEDRTLYVDKDAPGTGTGTGTMTDPFRYVWAALSAADTLASSNNNAVVRIVGNNFANDTSDPATLKDNVPYRIGFRSDGIVLGDGPRLEVPNGVTVMVDGGAVMQFQGAHIDVGSSEQNSDRSLGALQVLGTPWHSVYFTSAKDQVVGKDMDTSNTSPEAGDWGGLVFRNKEDYNTLKDTNPNNDHRVWELDGIFMNYVNHADMRYGGGGDRGTTGLDYDPIHMIESRPTVTFNSITNTVHHALSADPDSFLESLVESMPKDDAAGTPIYTADYGRVGPKIYGNYLRNNSLNGLFVRVDSDAVSGKLDKLRVAARFDDTDVVHVIQEFLAIQGDAGGPLDGEARPHGRLMVDPGTVVKLKDAHIEVEFGAQFVAEGVKNYPVILTSLYDNRYGAGGTFLTDRDVAQVAPAPGNWGGIEFMPTSTGSIDRTRMYYAGGQYSILGTSMYFNPIEARQADIRVTNTLFQYNTAHSDGDRFGRGDISPATIFVRGAQPILVGNTFRDNDGAVVSIDANSLKYTVVNDWGRTTGTIGDPSLGQNAADQFAQYSANRGPLVRANKMINNDYNGMMVRPTLLTTEGIWDDTDIVHILTGEVSIPNFHTYGGLRLQSSPKESLVIKLLGNNAGFTAAGRPLEIEDRIGGILQVEGTPGYPVILTSLRDDSVGAGFDPDGNPQFDTNNNGASTGTAGDWRSLKIDWYSHDRNVSIVNELESSFDNNNTTDANNNPRTPQVLGSLVNAVDPRPEYNAYQGTWVNTQKLGDENLRLGFEVQGSIRTDYAGDQDVYQFSGVAGTEVWIDVDKAQYGLDTIVELLDIDGRVLAWSDDSGKETAASGIINNVVGEVALAAPIDNVRRYQLDNYPVVPGSPSGDIRINVPGFGNVTLYTFTVNAAGQVNLTRSPLFPEAQYPIALTSAAFSDAAGTFDLIWNQDDPGLTSIRANYSYYVWQPSDYNTNRGQARNMVRDAWGSRDFYTTNPHDAGFRVVLPGTAGTQQNYYVRVRAKVAMVQSLDAKIVPDHSTFTVTNRLIPSPQGGTEWIADRTFEFVDLDGETPFVITPSATPIWFNKTNNPLDAIGIANLVKSALDASSLNIAVGVTSDAINNTAQLTIDTTNPDHLLSFDVGNTKLVRMNPGGTYQLQVRLREIQEYPGSAIQGAFIAYATNGIEVYGAVSHSPLTGETTATGTNTTAATRQYVGNLALSDREAITIAGNLTGTNVQFFEFDVDSQNTIQRAKPYGMEWPVTIDVDFADSLARADTSVWVFDNSGRLILIGGDSNVADDLVLPYDTGKSKDYGDQSRGSFGTSDAFIGPVYLPEHQDAITGGDISYVMAVTNQNVVPGELVNDPLLRIEPVNSIQRIVEDHVGSQNGSNIAQDAMYDLFDGEGMQLNLNANEYTLGDVVLYLNTGGNLYTVDPYTGAQETDVTLYGNLPNYDWGYTDIAMTNDGRLDTLVHQPNSNNVQFRQLSTGDAKNYVSTAAVGITFSDTNPAANPPHSALRTYPAGFTFNALAHSPNNNNRNIFGVGNFVGNPNNVNWTRNLMYVFNSAGSAIQRLNTSGGPRLVSDIIPYGYLYTAPTLVMPAATQIQPDNGVNYTPKGGVYIPSSTNDLDDGQSIVINDAAGGTGGPWTFEFDTGPDYRLAQNGPRSIRDGDTFTLNGSRFEFDSGEVVLLNDGAAVQDMLSTITVVGTATRRYKFTQGGATPGFQPIVYDPGWSAQQMLKATVDAINKDSAVHGVTARGYLGGGGTYSRISFFGGDTDIQVAGAGVAIDAATNYGISSGTRIRFEEIVTDSNDDAVDSAADIQTDMGGLFAGVAGVPGLVGMEASVNGVYPNSLHYAILNSPPNTYGARVTFMNGTVTGVNMQIPTSFQQMDLSMNGTTIAGARRVIIGADYSASEVATALANAINLAGITITGAPGGLNAQASGGGVALNNLGSGSTNFNNALPVSFQGQLGATGGDVTGMAFIGNTLYAVTDVGGLFEVQNVSLGDVPGNYAFNPVDPAQGYKYMTFNGGGPSLRYITTLTADGQPVGPGNPGIRFSGVSAGPQSVEDAIYSDLLFASDTGGNVYAFDTVGLLQPVFLDAATSVATGVGGATGIAFSNIDYNLWHATNERWSDQGHGLEQAYDLSRFPPDYRATGDTSFYFGLSDPRGLTIGGTAAQPGSDNYIDRSANMFSKYDVPGGAYGSVTTDPFSLEGYAYADKPTLYYTYYAQTEGGNDWDSARVFLSYDNVSWFILTTNTDMDSDVGGDTYGIGGTRTQTTGGSWRQARVDLSAAAGLGNLRLRFEFSTASDMHVGDVDTTGTYLGALEGWKLRDGQTFTIDDDTTFELEMGYSLEVPAFGGAGIPEGETFQIGTAVFEFTRDATIGVGNFAINIRDTDTTNEVILNIRNRINQVLPGSRAWVHLDANGAPDDNWIFLMGVATTVSNAASPAQTLQVHGGIGVAAGNTQITIEADDTDIQVAEAIADAIDEVYRLNPETPLTTGLHITGKLDGQQDELNVVRLIGHSVTDQTQPIGATELPYAEQSYGIGGSDPNHPVKTLPRGIGDRFTDYGRGQNNFFEGFYIDDVVIGFAERGEMVTGRSSGRPDAAGMNFVAYPGGPTDYPVANAPVGAVGAYQVEIHRTQEYGYKHDTDMSTPPRHLSLNDAYDTNDRMSQSFTMAIPAAADIRQGQSFTIGDGVNKLTFQLFNPDAPIPAAGQPGAPITGAIRIDVPSTTPDPVTDIDEPTTGAQVASAVVTAINSNNYSPIISTRRNSIKVFAVSNGLSNRLDLTGAGWLDTDDEITGASFPYFQFPAPTYPYEAGDENHYRDQGSMIIEQNLIVNSSDWGIVVAPNEITSTTSRDGAANLSHMGSVTPFRQINTERWVPSAVIQNNVVAFSGVGGITFRGDPNAGNVPDAAVPFGRIVNNTVYGGTPADPASSFNIDVNFTGGLTSSQQAIFSAAARRWERVITADLPDVGAIDDLAIDASGTDIDGSGGILGAAGPVGQRTGTYLPYSGQMFFDSADLAAMEADGSLLDVITHEMGHVLGFGTVWTDVSLLSGYGGADPQFTGPMAAAEYNTRFGQTGTSVPVEAGGGPGTAYAHWRESLFDNELMTGWLNTGVNPMSSITVASLGDIGYQVDVTSADTYLWAAGTYSQIDGYMVPLNAPRVYADATASASASGAPAGIGIDVRNNAAPTLMNNVVANLQTGIRVDGTSADTVVAYTAYSGNGNDLVGTLSNAEMGKMSISTSEPLFVDPSHYNFYPDVGARILDSSKDVMTERFEMNRVRLDLGIPDSPILAPEIDMYGQKRKAGPIEQGGKGSGSNVYKDLGAVDRVDILGPIATLEYPVDNGVTDNLANDREPAVNSVRVAGILLPQFTIQLGDPNASGSSGMGINDFTVVESAVHVYRDRTAGSPQLQAGRDYFFKYNPVLDEINLIPAEGFWPEGFVYTVLLDPTIRDLANNSLATNDQDPLNADMDVTIFTIAIAGFDYGDAPDGITGAPSYPVLSNHGEARHLLRVGYGLGDSVNSETEAKTSLNANGDLDDGVLFSRVEWTQFGSGATSTMEFGEPIGNGAPLVRSTASFSARTYFTVVSQGDGYVDAWIDWDQDGNWEEDDGEHIIVTSDLTSDQPREFSVEVPSTAVLGRTYGRFRFSSSPSGLGPTGEAEDGEIEDYLVNVVAAPEDYGDAPDHTAGVAVNYATLKVNSGASHTYNPLNPLHLGNGWSPEIDGQPDANADADDDDGVFLSPYQAPLVPGQPFKFTVSVQGMVSPANPAYLNAWMDFDQSTTDASGFDGPDEHLSLTLSSGGAGGSSNVMFDAPGLYEVWTILPLGIVPPGRNSIETIMRVRLSHADANLPTGPAPGVGDGEVEDYQVTVVLTAIDYGDAPDGFSGVPDYPTRAANDGPRHVMNPAFCLGTWVDYESDALSDIAALGDDERGSADPITGVMVDDEDGVTVPELRGNELATITVTVTGVGGYLNGWIDYNGDGDWGDTGEHVIDDELMDAASKDFEITVPTSINGVALVSRDTFARFRYSHEEDLGFSDPISTAPIPDGEVEDYLVELVVGTSSISGSKFFDQNANGKWDKTATNGPTVQFVSPGSLVFGGTGNDLVSAALPFNFNLEFYGQTYQSFYVSTNGIISMGQAVPSVGAGFPQSTPIIAPFWADADTRGAGEVRMASGTTAGGQRYVQIDWIGMGAYFMQSFPTNTFSVYIQDDPGGDVVAFKYGTMGWTDTIFGAELGFNAGDGATYQRVTATRPKTQADLAALSNKQFSYRFDPSTGKPFGAEPAMAGVQVYLDLNKDGSWQTIEPITTTLSDDPLTTANETGTYKFPGLFAGDYVVREIVPSQWLRTMPSLHNTTGQAVGAILAVPGTSLADGQTFSLIVGGTTVNFEFNDPSVQAGVTTGRTAVAFSATDTAIKVAQSIATAVNSAASALNLRVNAVALENNVAIGGINVVFNPVGANVLKPSPLTTVPEDGGYQLTLAIDQNVQGVDFGDYRLGTVSIADVRVGEGNSGLTPVEITVRLTDAFGAPVTVNYSTADGFLPNAATAADNDYVPVTNGSVTFTPQAPPVGGWSTKQITQNVVNDYDYSMWGPRVVWEEFRSNNWDIFFYDENTGLTKQISHETTENHFAKVYGSNIVWSGKAAGETDYESYLYNIDTGLTTRLTNNAFDDVNPQVSSRYATWWAKEGSFNQIWVQDLQIPGSLPFRVSATGQNNYEPQVSEQYVVWHGFDGVDNEVYVYDPINGRRALSNNNTDDKSPQIDATNGKANVVWEWFDGLDYEIVRYDLNATVAPFLTVLSNNAIKDSTPHLSGDNVVWQAVNGTQATIMYDDLSTTTVAGQAISDTRLYHSVPKVSGNRVVWHTDDVNNGQISEVTYYEIGSGDIPQMISRQGEFDGSPQVSDAMVVWRTQRGGNFEIVRAIQNEPELLATITLYVRGDTKVEADENFLVNLLSASLATLETGGSQAVIGILNDDGQMDYGDAPASYGTLLADDGARHQILTGFSLGNAVDSEANGQPSTAADGDDTVGVDDEDGVTFKSSLIRGLTGQIGINAKVPVGVSAMLDAWMDWNGDGVFDGTERITPIGGQAVSNGVNPDLQVLVPVDSRVTTAQARFRLSSTGGLAPYGAAGNGEVEDYAVGIVDGVRLLNRVVTVQGGDANDTFEFRAGTTTHTVILNGGVYPFAVADVDAVVFDGGLGTDIALLKGLSAAGDTAELWSDHGTLTGANSAYSASASNVETLRAYSMGGNDTVILHDNSGVNTLTYNLDNKGDTTFVGDGLNLAAYDFYKVRAFSTAGLDSAAIYDTAGNDVLEAGATLTTLKAGAVNVQVNNFRYVTAHARFGGTDNAFFGDSAGNDVFEARPTYSVATDNATFTNRANQFEYAESTSISGADTARFYDSAVTTSTNAYTFQGRTAAKDAAGYAQDYTTVPNDAVPFAKAKQFSNVYFYSIDAAPDRAIFKDSAATETLTVYMDTKTALLSGGGYQYRAYSFKTVDAFSYAGGDDTAKFFDSPGSDSFVARPLYGEMTVNATGDKATANGFRYIYGAAPNAGADTAVLTGKVGVKDYLYSTDTYATLSDSSTGLGKTYFLRAASFNPLTVNGTAADGDYANMSGSTGVDTFTGSFRPKVGAPTQLDPTKPYATLAGVGFSTTVNNFRSVLAKGSANDLALLYAAAAADTFTANVGVTSTAWSVNASLRNTTSFANTVQGFGNVHAYGVKGGTNAATLDAALTKVLLEGTNGNVAKLSNVDSTIQDFDIYAEDFGTLTAKAASTNQYARKRITDYVLGLTTVGPWRDME